MKNTILVLAVTTLASAGLVSCVAPAPVPATAGSNLAKGGLSAAPGAEQHNHGFGPFASSLHEPDVVLVPRKGSGPGGPMLLSGRGGLREIGGPSDDRSSRIREVAGESDDIQILHRAE